MHLFDFPQYSNEWWDVRRSVPTASKFSSIVTPANFDYSKQSVTYACQLIADLYDADYGRPSEFATAAMLNGTIMEPEARRFYEFDRDCEVRQVGFCLTDDRRFGSSPDGLVGDDGCLELKNPTPATQVRYLLDGGVPKEYLPQCHGHILVTGRAWCDFLAYSPGLPKLLVRVERDERTEKLGAALDEFWTTYQTMLARIKAGREEAIDEAITRKGEQVPENLKAMIPPDEEQPYF